MTSLVDMFLPARYTCNNKTAVQMFHAQIGVSRFWPVGGAEAVVQVADIKVRAF